MLPARPTISPVLGDAPLRASGAVVDVTAAEMTSREQSEAGNHDDGAPLIGVLSS
jgi:hypothetical protein